MNRNSRLFRTLVMIHEHSRVVRIHDLSNRVLDEWTAADVPACLPEVTVARHAPMLIFDFTPDDDRIPLKIFIYTYDHYCRGTFLERGPGNWLDEWAELRFVQFQYLLRVARLARRTRRRFPSFNLFDYGNYDRLVDAAASIDRGGQFRNLLSVIPLRIDREYEIN